MFEGNAYRPETFPCVAVEFYGRNWIAMPLTALARLAGFNIMLPENLHAGAYLWV